MSNSPFLGHPSSLLAGPLFGVHYTGSDPAQLRLALAADLLGDDKAQKVYQGLKFKLIGGPPPDGWTLTEGRVKAALEQQPARSR